MAWGSFMGNCKLLLQEPSAVKHSHLLKISLVWEKIENDLFLKES